MLRISLGMAVYTSNDRRAVWITARWFTWLAVEESP